MRFNDDEGRVLEVHVTNWCDVDVTERVLVEVGEPGLFGRHVPDVRVTLGDALDAAKNPDPSLGSILKTSYRLTGRDDTRSGWYRTDGDMLVNTPELVVAVNDGVRSVSKGKGKSEWNL